MYIKLFDRMVEFSLSHDVLKTLNLNVHSLISHSLLNHCFCLSYSETLNYPVPNRHLKLQPQVLEFKKKISI